jgi:protein-tyrosine-phosphatase
MADFRILAVCTGNVHRSAFAAVMLREWSGWYLTSDVSARISVSSAGTRAASGAPMDAGVLAIVAALGGDGHDHRAAQLSDASIESSDLVLTATRRHRMPSCRAFPRHCAAPSQSARPDASQNSSSRRGDRNSTSCSYASRRLRIVVRKPGAHRLTTTSPTPKAAAKMPSTG